MKRTPVERVDVSAFVIPTDAPEADGTFEWQSTTLVVVEARAGDVRGIGARVLGISTLDLLGVARERVCVYGSGSFTSYDTDRLCTQLAG